MTIRSALIACLVLSACLPALAPRPEVALVPKLDPVAFFTGRTHGEGTLERRFGAGRKLTVEGVGQSNAAGDFQLDQTITWEDGAVETRRWVLRREESGRFTATLSDASGEVDAEATGNLFHLRYQIRQPRVFMEQWLYLQPDGRSVLNLAQVTVLGIPYARLSETITRQGPGGHPRLLGREDLRHPRGRNRRRRALDDAQSRLRGEHGDLPRLLPRHPRRAGEVEPLPSDDLLARRRRHHHGGHHGLRHVRPHPRPGVREVLGHRARARRRGARGVASLHGRDRRRPNHDAQERALLLDHDPRLQYPGHRARRLPRHRRRTRLPAWAAYVLTRPLGATLGDTLTKPHADGGLAFGRFTSTLVLGVAMVVVVATTSLRRRSSHPDARAADERRRAAEA